MFSSTYRHFVAWLCNIASWHICIMLLKIALNYKFVSELVRSLGIDVYLQCFIVWYHSLNLNYSTYQLGYLDLQLRYPSLHLGYPDLQLRYPSLYLGYLALHDYKHVYGHNQHNYIYLTTMTTMDCIRISPWTH